MFLARVPADVCEDEGLPDLYCGVFGDDTPLMPRDGGGFRMSCGRLKRRVDKEVPLVEWA